MGTSRDSGQQRTSVRKTARKAAEATAQGPLQPLKKTLRERPAPQDASSSRQSRRILTQEEFRARVARKAFELYLKRHAVTEVDDWVKAEELVRQELLMEEQAARSA